MKKLFVIICAIFATAAIAGPFSPPFGGSGGGISAETNTLETTITGIADTEIFIGNGVDSGTFSAMSGDATLSNTGLLTIGADKILESNLKSVNAATDEECLTYEATGGDFEWQACGSGAGDLLADGTVPMTAAFDLGTVGQLSSSVADGASAVAYTLNSAALTTAGAKFLSLHNNGTEQAFIQYVNSEEVSFVLDAPGRTDRTVSISGTASGSTIKSDTNLTFTVPQGLIVVGPRGNNSAGVGLGTTGVAIGRSLTTDFAIDWGALTSDVATKDITMTGRNAWVNASATTNKDGGNILLTGGAGNSSHSTGSDGGNIVLTGGAGSGTGSAGNVLVNDTIYGIISTQAGVTSQDDIGTTPEILVAWNTDGIANGLTVSHTNDYITATTAGVYEVNVATSFSGTGSSLVTMEIYVYDDSGTSWSASGFAMDRKLGTGGDVGSTSHKGLVTLDVSDRVAVYIATDGATDDVTVTEAQLVVKRISD